MREQKMLRDLRRIRHFREKRAEEKLVTQHARLMKAERDAADARAFTDAEIERIASSEHDALATVCDRTVSGTAFVTMQMGREAHTRSIEVARQQQHAAEEATQKQLRAVHEAQRAHAHGVKSVAKLDNALEHLRLRDARRSIAAAEQEMEDDGGSAGGQPPRAMR